MSQDDNPEEKASPPGATPKRPYQAPKILYREKLEVMAAVCTPSPPAKANPGACPTGPINS